MDNRKQSLELVFQSRSRKECHEHALVLKAVGIAYQVHNNSGEFSLFVSEQDAARCLAEFDAYSRENRDWPVVDITLPQQSGSGYGVYGYVAMLLIVAILSRDKMFGLDWYETGMTQAGLIRSGQLWRTITALTLHADISHLVANTVIGGLFGLFVGQLLGNGLAWLSILLAGASGNLMNAWIRDANHTSIGASTAVFAALGILAAYSWIRRLHLQKSLFKQGIPLIGGVLLLSYLGTGGGRTDVAAHVTGFLSGVFLGAIYAKLGDRIMFTAKTQFFLGGITIAILAIAWMFAFTNNNT